MNRFDEILSAYRVTSERFGRDLAASEDPQALRDLQAINEQAYFLLLFAQFEDHVKEYVATRVEAGIRVAGMTVVFGQTRALLSRTDWLARLALLKEMIGAETHRQVEAMTRDRNKIAHGTLLTSGIDLVERATLLKEVAAILTLESP